MARTETLANMRTRIRSLSGVRPVSFSDANLLFEINNSIAELYDKLVAADADYYESTHDYNIVADTASYALPSDFYKVVGVSVLRNSGEYVPIRKYNRSDRHKYSLYKYKANAREYMEYRVRGSNIIFNPTPNWTDTAGVRLFYIPAPVKFATDDDGSGTFDGIAGWEDWVVFDCCIKLVGGYEEGDASYFEKMLMRLNQRIDTLAKTRDYSEPDTMRDLDEEDSERLWPHNGTPP